VYEIELEVEKLLIKAEKRAKEIITINRSKFDKIVKGLMDKHTLNKEELLEIEFSDYIVD
jgi:ATP-dependent Zn protease